MDLLAPHIQHLAARGQHSHRLATFEDLVNERGGGVDDVLAVVEDQQDLARRQEVDELDRRPSGPGAQGHAGKADGSRHGAGDHLRVGDRCEIREEDAVREPFEQARRRLDRQSRLPASTDPGQRDQAANVELLLHRGDVDVPADESRSLRRQVLSDRERAKRRKLGRPVAVGQLEDPFGTGDVPEPVQA
jgi:hypothetical protein